MKKKMILHQKIRIIGLLLVIVFVFGFGCHTPRIENSKKTIKGSFKVVGIGPGDADLLTSRALEAIRRADLVFCNSRTQEKLKTYIG